MSSLPARVGSARRTSDVKPAVLVLVAATVVGSGSGALVGPLLAVLFGAVGFAWGTGVAFLAVRLNRCEPRRRAWRHAVVFATVLLAGALLLVSNDRS